MPGPWTRVPVVLSDEEAARLLELVAEEHPGWGTTIDMGDGGYGMLKVRTPPGVPADEFGATVLRAVRAAQEIIWAERAA